MRKFFLSLTCLIIILGFQTISWARNTNIITDSFIEHGRQQFSKGHIDQAIDDFSRALLLDPANSGAINSLIQLKSYPGLNGEQTFNLYYLEDLIGQISKLEQKIDYIFQKCGILTRSLNQGDHNLNLRHIMEETESLSHQSDEVMSAP